jgi:hypothetical protein
MEHPADDVLFRFLLGTSSPEENRQVVRHLLARCQVCAETLRKMKREPPVEPDAYDEALDRCTARLRKCAGAPKPAPRQARVHLARVLRRAGP